VDLDVKVAPVSDSIINAASGMEDIKLCGPVLNVTTNLVKGTTFDKAVKLSFPENQVTVPTGEESNLWCSFLRETDNKWVKKSPAKLVANNWDCEADHFTAYAPMVQPASAETEPVQLAATPATVTKTETEDTGISAGALAGGIVGAAVFAAVVVGIIVYMMNRGNANADNYRDVERGTNANNNRLWSFNSGSGSAGGSYEEDSGSDYGSGSDSGSGSGSGSDSGSGSGSGSSGSGSGSGSSS